VWSKAEVLPFRILGVGMDWGAIGLSWEAVGRCGKLVVKDAEDLNV
jgi:hypothetical protein